MADQHYYLWSKAHCPFCSEAQSILLQKIKSYTVHVMNNKLEELENIKEKYDYYTVPIIVLQEDDKETFIGGCSDLKKWLSEGEESD